MNITIKRTVNLSEPILPEVLPAPLYEGEKNAHTFMITAEKDKLPHALSGSVVAYFERNDGNTVRVEGETIDGCAILTLSPECYQTGVFYLAVMLIADGAQTVIYAASGRVRNTQDGEIIDGRNTIPTYDEIMAHLNKYLSTDITAKVEETEDGARITMKDVVNGETTAVVKNGKSAYEIAKENGFEGTEEEWLESLKSQGGANNCEPEIFYVPITPGNYSNSPPVIYKTDEEIINAYKSGKLVVGLYRISKQEETPPQTLFLTYMRLPDEYNNYAFYFSGNPLGSHVIHIEVANHYEDTQDTHYRSAIIRIREAAYQDTLPTTLPNPKAITIIAPDGTQYAYDGAKDARVPLTQIPWDAISDKPFGSSVVFKEPVYFETRVVLINTPFALEEGKTYQITIGDAPYVTVVTSIAEASKFLGKNFIGLGNHPLMTETGDNGEPYAILNFPDGIDFYGDGSTQFGIFVITDESLAPTFVGETLQIKIELAEGEGAKPIPTEWINYGKANAGKLLYVKDDGTLEPLNLGAGLKIVDGVLTIEASTARAIAGMALAGQIKVGEV